MYVSSKILGPLALIVVSFVWSSGSQAVLDGSGQPLIFEDPNFEACVDNAFGSSAPAVEITQLYCSGVINSLVGISQLTNLEVLELSWTSQDETFPPLDFTEVAALPSLYYLGVDGTRFNDSEFLKFEGNSTLGELYMSALGADFTNASFSQVIPSLTNLNTLHAAFGANFLDMKALTPIQTSLTGLAISKSSIVPIAGDWVLDGDGAAIVGPTPGSADWFSSTAWERPCWYDDIYRFGEDGSFLNILGDETWVEWGGTGGCAAPVPPHDGSTQGIYSFDGSTLTVSGQGAYVALAKAVNGSEVADPTQAPSEITYQVVMLSQDLMTLQIETNPGVWWTFRLRRSSALPSPGSFLTPIATLNNLTSLEFYDALPEDFAYFANNSIAPIQALGLSGEIGNPELAIIAEKYSATLSALSVSYSDVTDLTPLQNIPLLALRAEELNLHELRGLEPNTPLANNLEQLFLNFSFVRDPSRLYNLPLLVHLEVEGAVMFAPDAVSNLGLSSTVNIWGTPNAGLPISDGIAAIQNGDPVNGVPGNDELARCVQGWVDGYNSASPDNPLNWMAEIGDLGCSPWDGYNLQSTVGIEHLVGLRSLTAHVDPATFADNYIPYTVYEHLANAVWWAPIRKSLTTLNVGGGVEDWQFGNLASFPGLESLYIDLSRVNSLEPLRYTRNLKHFTGYDWNWEQRYRFSIEPLYGLPDLATLDLNRQAYSDFSELSDLTQTSWLHVCGGLSTEDINLLSSLTHLSNLDLNCSGSTLGDAEIYQLTESLPNLGHLSVYGSDLSSFSSIIGIDRFWYLNVGGTLINDYSLLIDSVNSGKSELCCLDIHQTIISDADLQALQLAGIEVYGTPGVDSDNDGVVDAPYGRDVFPEDSFEQYDRDEDGVGDNGDAFPDDPAEQYDTDSDGLGDNLESNIGTDIFEPDTDGDGLTDAEEYLGSVRGFYTDPLNADSDGDGSNDSVDFLPWDSRFQNAMALSDVPSKLVRVNESALDNPSINTQFGGRGNTWAFNSVDKTGLRSEVRFSNSFTWSILDGILEIDYAADDYDAAGRFVNTNISPLPSIGFPQSEVDAYLANHPDQQIEVFYYYSAHTLTYLGENPDEPANGYYLAQLQIEMQMADSMLSDAIFGSGFKRATYSGTLNPDVLELVDISLVESVNVIKASDASPLPFRGALALRAHPEPLSAATTSDKVAPDTLLFDVGGTGSYRDSGTTFSWTEEGNTLLLTLLSGESEGATVRLTSYDDYGGQYLVYVDADVSVDNGGSGQEKFTMLEYGIEDQFAYSPAERLDIRPMLWGFLQSGYTLVNPGSYDEFGNLYFSSYFGFHLIENAEQTAVRIYDMTPQNGWVAGSDTWFWHLDSGVLTLEARWRRAEGQAQGYAWYTNCQVGEADPECEVFRSRTWRVLQVTTDRIYVLEEENSPAINLYIPPRVQFYELDRADRDNDLDWDWTEIFNGKDPYVFNDSDNDNLSDREEFYLSIDPWNPDTDGDGVEDGYDAFPGDSTEQYDSDADGLGDNFEITSGTDPYNADTDQDGISDFDEVNGTNGFYTSATSSDTDGDGTSDLNDVFPLSNDWQAPVPLVSATEIPAQMVEFVEGAVENPSLNMLYRLGGDTWNFNSDSTGKSTRSWKPDENFNWLIDSEGRLQLNYPVDPSREVIEYRKVSSLGFMAERKAIAEFIEIFGDIDVEIRASTASETFSFLGAATDCACFNYWIETKTRYVIVDPDTRFMLLGDVNAEPVIHQWDGGYESELVDLQSETQLTILDTASGLPFGGSQAMLADVDLGQENGFKFPHDTMIFNSDGTGSLFDRGSGFDWVMEGESLIVRPSSGPGAGSVAGAEAVITYKKYEQYTEGQSLIYVTINYPEWQEQYSFLAYAVPDVFAGGATESELSGLLDEFLITSLDITSPYQYDDVDQGIIGLSNLFGYRLNSDGTASRLLNAQPGQQYTDTWFWRLEGGTLFLDAKWLKDSQGNVYSYYPNCDEAVDIGCEIFRTRSWRILDIENDFSRLYVMESDSYAWGTKIIESRVNFYATLPQDRDGDLVSDLDEVFSNLDPYTFNDSDGDGLSDRNEYNVGSDPFRVDSDFDGVTDYDEVITYGTNPALADSDGDGLSDFEELFELPTDPLKADSDGDGYDDAVDQFPVDISEWSDFDGDGLGDNFDDDDDNDLIQDSLDADPYNANISGDADFDGIQDGWEVAYYGSISLDPALDSDNDGLTARMEFINGSDPSVFDQAQQIFVDGDFMRTNQSQVIRMMYDVSDGNNYLTGLGLRVHFNSSQFSRFEIQPPPDVTSLLGIDNVWQFEPSNLDLDGDYRTDAYITISWVDYLLSWPAQTLPLELFSIKVVPTEQQYYGGNATINFSPAATSEGYALYAPAVTLPVIEGGLLDIDGDGKVKPLTDGLMVLRRLFGFTGEFGKITASEGEFSADWTALDFRLDQRVPLMDIDGDGEVKALTDGLLLIRYLFGFTGQQLTAGAVGATATRTDPALIAQFIESRIAD